jgi:glycerate dehydrogenase
VKLVVLDGYTANPGDLSWTDFEAFGELSVYERTPVSSTVERANGAEIVLTNKTLLDATVIAALPDLRYIGVLATGYNVVDVAAARGRSIAVANVPAYGTENVAQAVFALILELTNRTGHHAQTVREGRWSRHVDWCYWDYPLIELCGRTLGIVGYGRIGAAVARIAKAFGMKVIAARRQPVAGDAEVSMVDLDTLFREADVVSLHCPLTPETKHLVNAERLEQMKRTALLINTARGPLIDEPALAAALDREEIAGAGLDVLSVEPPPPGNPLLQAKNCLITPHIAWATREARARLLKIAADNVRAWLAGKPQNLVS